LLPPHISSKRWEKIKPCGGSPLTGELFECFASTQNTRIEEIAEAGDSELFFARLAVDLYVNLWPAAFSRRAAVIVTRW